MKLVYNDTSHSYWLDGKRVKSASKVAQIAADSYTVEQWQKRQVAIGMTLDRTLIERVAVDLDNREAIQQVCEDAANAAKANARAHRGTQRHRVFELGLLGRQDQFVTDQQIADWKVLERTLEAYGLQPIPDRVEQFIAWPDNGVVGRYDAYLYHCALGMPVLVDLKGGLNAVKYPHSTAVQMWLYRNAPHTSATIIRDGDKSEVEDWTTPPKDAATDFGYVLYCDDHHDVGELWQINLRGAAVGGSLALGIVDWRKQHNYGKELACPIALNPTTTNQTAPSTTTSAEPPTPEDSNSPSSKKPSKTTQLAAAATTNSTTTSGASEQPATTSSATADPTYNSRRARLLERYRTFSDVEKMAYCDLHVDGNDLDAVEAALDQVDRFNVTVEPVAPQLTVVPDLPKAPDEGGPILPVDVNRLQTRFNALDAAAQAWTSTLVVQGKNSHDFRIKDRATERRYHLYRGILALAEWSGGGVDDVVKAICNHVGIFAKDTPPGEALGCLNAKQAAEFAALANGFVTGRYAVQDDGLEGLRISAATTK